MNFCHIKKLTIILFVFIFLFTGCGDASVETTIVETSKDPNRIINVGIAWKCNDNDKPYESTISAIETVGGNPVVLSQVISNELAYTNKNVLTDAMIDSDGDLSNKSAEIVKTKTYSKTNVESVMNGIDAVIFLGGEDISPSLLATPKDVANGSDPYDTINPTRDVSDYILMSYCLDNDIPVLGICRGMQMLAIVSGAELIQDLSLYYESLGVDYDYYHRMSRNADGSIADYVPHNVDIIDSNSLIYKIVNSNVIEDVPSWHHQAVACNGVENLKATATATNGGITIDEVIERTDKTFALGVLFHPEAVVEKFNKQKNYADFTDTNIVFGIFNSLLESSK